MKRIKFKNRLQTIVSIFLIVSILCATAAIFVGIRVDDTETNHITDVGYILGTSRGTGSLVSSANCITFAETDKDILLYRGNVSALLKNSLSSQIQILSGGSDVSSDGTDYAVIESVENGDSYLKLYRGIGTSPMRAFFECDSVVPYPSRGGKVIVEFDFKMDDGFEFDYSKTSDPLLCEMSFVGSLQEALHYSYLDPVRYSYGGLHMSNVEGYYVYEKNWKDVESTDNYLMKFGEWYNFRFEFEYDRKSTRYSLELYVNDISVDKTTADYHSSNLNSNAFAFMISPRMYAHDLEISIDNYNFKTQK